MPNFADKLPELITVAIFLLIAFPVHEFSHAAVAYLQGDATAKLFGRLTLNPIVHFDPYGGLMTIISVVFTGFIIGWAKPTPVNPANLHDRRNGEVLVALAGPASNFLMALVGAFIYRVLDAAGVDLIGTMIGLVLYLFVLYNVLLAIFNFIPVPPLDGSALLYRILTAAPGLAGPAVPDPVRDLRRPRGRPPREPPAEQRHLHGHQCPGGRVRPASSVRTCSRACAPRSAPRWRRGCGPRSWSCSTPCTSPIGATASTSSPRCGGPA